MARIYDNIELKFTKGLHDIITNHGVKRLDFCVGYFNLRGWNLVVDEVDKIEGDEIYEGDEKIHRVCRLLIGMHRPPEEILRRLYSNIKNDLTDSDDVKKCKRQIATEFRKQLTVGVPTKQDEITLRKLSTQLKEGKVVVKLYLKEPLHAKLYLAHRPADNFNGVS